jgi:hypothetical protein
VGSYGGKGAFRARIDEGVGSVLEEVRERKFSAFPTSPRRESEFGRERCADSPFSLVSAFPVSGGPCCDG